MDLYDLMSPVETMLANKADIMREPLGGSMELTPLCNMNCKMCYIRQDKEEMNKQGRLLSVEEWLKIAKEAKQRGVLYLLLTGGEPFTYPGFKELYQALTGMGFVITINTNGTLIDENIIELLKNNPCRRLNITLYGKNDETYSNLCKNPKGFTQVMNAAKLLQENNIPFRFNCSLTPDNVADMKELCEIAQDLGVEIKVSSYMFPPMRFEKTHFQRLTPQEAAKAEIDMYRYKNGNINMSIAAKNTLNLLEQPNKEADIKGISCRAGRSGFWMSWNGNLLPCGMFPEPKISLLSHTFADAWNYIVKETERIAGCSDCKHCSKRNVCRVCAAGCLTETGKTSDKPHYLCDMADSFIDYLKQLSEGEIE